MSGNFYDLHWFACPGLGGFAIVGEHLIHWEQAPFFGSWFCVGWDDGKSCVACSSGKAAFVTFFRLWYINLQLTRFRWKTSDA